MALLVPDDLWLAISAAVAARAAEAEGWTAPDLGSCGRGWHPVRAAHGYPVARGPGRARPLRQDVLAQAGPVTCGRGLDGPAPGALDWRRAALDSASLPKGWGGWVQPTERGRPGMKRHLFTDARGTPLGLRLSDANRNDSMMLAAIPSAVSGVRARRRGRSRKRPAKLHAEKGCDHRRCCQECRARGIRPRITRRGVESSTHPGRLGWVVEHTFAWLARFRRLSVRYESRTDLHLALTTLVCAVICRR